jgi:hypothetical protein
MNIFTQLAEVCKPQTITIGNGFIGFDFKIDKSKIYTGNLTPEVLELINSVDTIESYSQSLLGYKRENGGNYCKWEARAHYWSEEDLKEHAQYMKEEERKKPHWFIDSIGGNLGDKNIQWVNTSY